jgi:hypothetical protein
VIAENKTFICDVSVVKNLAEWQAEWQFHKCWSMAVPG